MFKSLKYFKPVLFASLLFLASACNKSKKSQIKNSGTTQQVSTKEVSDMVYKTSCSTEGIKGIMAVTHFNFDSSVVLPEAQSVIDDHVAKCVKQIFDENQGKDYKVLITGHCDKRGTKEYNIALGSRRANATKSYILGELTSLVKADENLSQDEKEKQDDLYKKSICTSSKGKEELVDKGDAEIAHAKNRRTVIEIVDECN